MSRPIRYVVSATSAADFVERLTQTDPTAFDDHWLLAEGDSWFNKFYPARNNLLDQLDLPRGIRLIDHSWSGDKAEDMFGVNRLTQIAQYLDIKPYKAILLSAGGNDLIGQIGDFIDGSGSAAVLNDAKVDDAFQKVESLIRAFCYSRHGTPNESTRVFIHAYDYPTPRNAPTLGGAVGPWVYPRLMTIGIRDIDQQRGVVTDLLTRWQIRLAQLAEPTSPKHIPGFHVLLTQGLLRPAAPNTSGRSGDWEDEIHPSNAGYKVFAERLYNPVLRAILAGA